MPPRQRLILALLIPLTAAAIVLLVALLAQPEPTSPDDLYLTSSAYLSFANVLWLELVAFAPLFIALAFVWQHEQTGLEFFQPELWSVFGIWISLANGYGVAYMLTLVGMLPKFEPPLQSLNDPRLPATPINYPAAALLTGVVAFYLWFIFFRRRGFGGIADRIVLPQPPTGSIGGQRRAALLALLALLAVTVWLIGGIQFALLMIPPAWFWILIEPRPGRPGKMMNVILGVGGIAAFGVMFLLLPNGLNGWHLILAAAYGVFFPLDVLLFFLLAALFLRFLRLGFAITGIHH